MPILSLSDITLAFGGPPLFDGISLQIEEGDRLAMIGRNGCGKTTLMSLMAGETVPESGSVTLNQGTKLTMVSQEIPSGIDGSVYDVVASGMGEACRLISEYHYLAHHPSLMEDDKVMARFEDLQHAMDESGAWSLHSSVEKIVNRLKLNPDSEFNSLSGGTKRRVLLARALVSAPDILLLDEPTNHLDIDTIIWLEEFLLKEVKTFIFVTHDRAFARKLANRVAELDRGRIYTFQCGYDSFVERREGLLDAEIKRRALFDKKLAAEESWIRQGIKARRTRNEGRVRALKAMREEYRKRRERVGKANIAIQEGDRSGEMVAKLENVTFAYPGQAPIFSGISLTILRGAKIGVIGSNGAGKSTLLKLILGDLSPVSGEVKLGTRREIIYFDQLREQLDLNASVIENIGEGNDTITINGRQRHVIGYLQDFLFSPERARSPVSILSGGEKNRLMMAKLFTKPSNIIVMDEPTNDLDAETLDLLDDLLVEYSGTLLLVSHDREFIDNVATSTIVLSSNGTVSEYPGGYSDWLDQSKREIISNKEQQTTHEPKRMEPKKEKLRKLSFKEERELEQLPEEISSLEREQRTLHEKLADPDFYKSSGGEIPGINNRLAEIEELLLIRYERWEELESIKEGAL